TTAMGPRTRVFRALAPHAPSPTSPGVKPASRLLARWFARAAMVPNARQLVAPTTATLRRKRSTGSSAAAPPGNHAAPLGAYLTTEIALQTVCAAKAECVQAGSTRPVAPTASTAGCRPTIICATGSTFQMGGRHLEQIVDVVKHLLAVALSVTLGC